MLPSSLPDWGRLRVFFHVHRAGSATAAAAELHVTQSAVSQSLTKLEQELGAQLFVRRHRRLVPTPAARRLYAIVSPFVAALEGGVREIHRAQHGLAGTLRLGAPVELGAHRLPPVMAAFRVAHPGAAFELSLGPASEVLPRLYEGGLDLALVDVFEAPFGAAGSAERASSARMAGLEVVEVMEEQLVLVAACAYEARVLAGSRAFGRLAEASFVEYQPSAPAVRGWFRHAFGRVPPRLHLALVVESVQAVITAVRHGMGLGLVPSHTVAAELEAGTLVVVATRKRPVVNRVSLVRVLDRVPSRLEKAFVRFLERWTAR
jgi:LysR family transcriptional regulator, transcriptional activator of the cysJI operon